MSKLYLVMLIIMSPLVLVSIVLISPIYLLYLLFEKTLKQIETTKNSNNLPKHSILRLFMS